jgi:tRNA1Val (adenine37-N6)-methyltransferase
VVIVDLLEIIAGSLTPGGRFYLLLPYKRHEEIMKLLDQKKIFLSRKILVRQSDNHAYFRFMIEGRFERSADSISRELLSKIKKTNTPKNLQRF